MRRLLLAFSLASCLLSLASAAERRPNVLFLFTDDQRADTIGALGNPRIKTPHLDRLVRTGTSFDNAYIMGASCLAVCTPSRASLFSGRTLWNLACQGAWDFAIPEKYSTMTEVFRENGYTTFATGKQDPGFGKDDHFQRSFSAGDHLSFAFMSWHRAVRDGRHKLIEYCVDGARHTQLFDLRDDPAETKNLAGDKAHAGTLARLRTLLENEAKRLNDGQTESPVTTAMGTAFWEPYRN